jgi:hypothetical protein
MDEKNHSISFFSQSTLSIDFEGSHITIQDEIASMYTRDLNVLTILDPDQSADEILPWAFSYLGHFGHADSRMIF